MKKFFTVCTLIFLSPLSLLASPIINEPEKPYAVTFLTEAVDQEQVFLGSLDGAPEMYEFKLSATSTFSAQLRQPEDDLKAFSFIVVRQDDIGGGVTEVGRLMQPAAEWSLQEAKDVGFSFRSSDSFEREIGAGTYRLEVNSPDNSGNYMLVFNGENKEENSYKESLGEVRLTQDFFGYSSFRMFSSSLIYYPLGIIALIAGIGFTWWWQKQAAKKKDLPDHNA